MTTLNRATTAALMELSENANIGSDGEATPIHAVTDVTGFGVLGHAREMALGDPSRGIESTSFELDHSAFNYLPGAVEAAHAGHLSGGLKNNRAFVAECAAFAENVPQEFRDLLFDPQTSGGLLVAIAHDFAADSIAVLARHGVEACQIGRVVTKRSPLLLVK